MLLEKIKLKYYKLKDSRMSDGEKFNLLLRLENNEIDISSIKYLYLEGYCSEVRCLDNRERYIFINSFVKSVSDRNWLNQIQRGIWQSGIYYKVDLEILNGICTYGITIKP